MEENGLYVLRYYGNGKEHSQQKQRRRKKFTLLSNGSALLLTLQHENKDLVHCTNLVTMHQDNF